MPANILVSKNIFKNTVYANCIPRCVTLTQDTGIITKKNIYTVYIYSLILESSFIFSVLLLQPTKQFNL